MEKCIKLISVILLLALWCGAAWPAVASPFNGCGQLVQGQNCLLFAHDGRAQVLLALSDYGVFHAGDRVCVSGDLVMGCQTPCLGAAGCVFNDSITPCPPAPPFQGCGSLVQEGSCVLFAPHSDPNARFLLDNYGPFQPGDSVCVDGHLEAPCQTSCNWVSGCVRGNMIDSLPPPCSHFKGCGVLIQDYNCVVFAPGGGAQVRFAIDSLAGFVPGDTVHVVGEVFPSCSTSCPGASGCLAVDSIHVCGHPNSPPIPGFVITKLESGNFLSTILIEFHSLVLDSVPPENIYLLSFPDSIVVDSMLAWLRSRPEVLFAEPNYEMGLPEVLQMSISFPDEYALPFVLGTSPPDYYGQPASYSVGADSAHLRSTGEGVIVAVIDNGVDFSHPLLSNSFISTGYDFFDDDPDPSEIDGTARGHGTFVSGLIKLTAPGCELLPLRAFNGEGIGSSFAISQSIFYAIEHGAKIINMSFGLHENSCILARACSSAVAAGVTLVASGGNDGTFMPIFPAMLPNVIAVSALDTIEILADFSNFGDYIDVCAPGVKLYGALSGDYLWGTWSGTSFSAALVSGACALARAVDTTFSAKRMEAHIKATALKALQSETISPPDYRYGYGKIDAAGAVWSLSPSGSYSGDVDGNGIVNISDVVYLVNFIFSAGPPPEPSDIGDADCDGQVNVSDVILLQTYIFTGAHDPGCH